MLTAVLARGSRYPASAQFALVVGLGYLVLLVWAMVNTSYDIWGALLIAPVLGVASVAVMTRASLAAGDQRLTRLLQWAVVYKGAMTLVRYFVVEVVYGGAADASQYHAVGGRLADAYRQFDFIRPDEGRIIGTTFLEMLTGAVYAITGQTRLGGFFVFSWFSLMGFFLLYRAFCIAVPTGDQRRYAILALFMPSLAFWPSSIGKDAWMVLCIGLAAYGVAVLLSGRPWGAAVMGLGLAGTSAVRPHITLMLFVGLVAAYLVRRPTKRTVLGPVTRGLAVVLLLAGGAVVARSVESFFKVDDLTPAAVEQVLSRTEDRSTKGEASYDPVDISSGVGLVLAPVTVLFRPFPNEAHNLEALLASAEGTIVFGLVLLNLRRLAAAARLARGTPYLVMAAFYVSMFVFAFSSMGNFGILARQRVQVLPFLFVFLALPAVVRRAEPGPRLTVRPVAGVRA